jgi:tetratricopeptide (TPR) repeat protein
LPGYCRKPADQAKWTLVKEWLEKSWRLLLVCGLLAAATLATFWPQVHNDFINYDDPVYVTLNPHVSTGLTWSNFKWTWTANCASNWHPLTLLSHMLDVQLFGLNAGGHHLVSLLLHTANSLLLLLLLRSLTGALGRSALVAALFALHPLHVESVAWVSERKDVLSAFFFLLALLAYTAYANRCNVQQNREREEGRGKREASDAHSPLSPLPSPVFYTLALLAFALGLMSKPMLVTLPFVLLLLDFWPLRRLELPIKNQTSQIKSLLLEKIPFFVVSVISCVVTVVAQRHGEAISSLDTVSLPQRLANAAVSCVAYLKQTIWPTGLSVFYRRSVEFPPGTVLGCALLLLAITVVAVRLARTRPYLLVGWCWFLGMLVPVIGLVQVGNQARADRYTYLPLIGIFIAVVWDAAELLIQFFNSKRQQSSTSAPAKTASAPNARKLPPQPTIQPSPRNRAAPALMFAGAALLIIPLALAAHHQVNYWQNSQTLFTHSVNLDLDNYLAWQNLGIADLERNDPAAALTHFLHAHESARLFGQERAFKYFIGATLQLQGKGLDALPYLEQAIVAPDFRPQLAYRLGLSLIATGRLDEAESSLKQAVASQPDVPEFQLGLASFYEQKGQPADARRIFQHVIETHPESATAQRALADLLMSQNQPAEAETHYVQALKLTTPNAGLRRAYATALAASGKTAPAIEQLQLARKQDPDNPAVNLALGELLAEQGDNRGAVACYEKCIQVEPKSVGALNNLAWMLATSPDNTLRNGTRAVELADRACELTEWKQAFMMGTLAAAYAEAGRFPEAIAMAEKARDKARADKLDEVVKRNEELLALYRAGKPYHEAP